MLGSMKSLFITVAGILLSLVASLANIVWLAVLSTVVALVGAYAQYKDALPYEFVFDGSSWQGAERNLKLVIPKKQHKKVNPTATVFKRQNQSYEEINCDVGTDESDAIILGAVITFEGKVVIK